jgi:CheY-like chemotaxis protein
MSPSLNPSHPPDPSSRSGRRQRAAAAKPLSAALDRVGVAIVDDDENIHVLIKDILDRSQGFQWVGSYSSGEAALAGIPQSGPQVVLMDIRMPGMSGNECARRLKALFPRLIVVMITGLNDPLGEAAGLNRYSYVENSPINLVDPLGLQGLQPLPPDALMITPEGVFGLLGGIGDFLRWAGNEVGEALGLGRGVGDFAMTGIPELGAFRQPGLPGPCPKTPMITVLGSKRDVAKFKEQPGYNVLNFDNLPRTEWPRANALKLNEVIVRGDQIWLVTDPAKHAAFIESKGFQSFYLDLELPMLNQYSAVNVIPKFATSPASVVVPGAR